MADRLAAKISMRTTAPRTRRVRPESGLIPLNDNFSEVKPTEGLGENESQETITYSATAAAGGRADGAPPQPRVGANLLNVVAMCRAALDDSDRLPAVVDLIADEIDSRSRAARVFQGKGGFSLKKAGRYVSVEKYALSALRRMSGKNLRASDIDDMVSYDSDEGMRPADSVVTDLMRQGLDGQRLLQSVVRFEAQWHVALVMMVATKLSRSKPGTTAADFATWGWVGLHSALRSFDPSLGWKFSTYACQKIDFSIRGGWRDTQCRPKKLITIYNKVSTVRGVISNTTGREASVADALELLGDDTLPDSKYLEEMFTRLQPDVSLDALVDAEGQGDKYSYLLADDAEDSALDRVYVDAALAALDGLPDLERKIVQLAILERVPMVEISRSTGMPTAEVKRLKLRGVGMLRDSMEENGLVGDKLPQFAGVSP